MLTCCLWDSDSSGRSSLGPGPRRRCGGSGRQLKFTLVVRRRGLRLCDPRPVTRGVRAPLQSPQPIDDRRRVRFGEIVLDVNAAVCGH